MRLANITRETIITAWRRCITFMLLQTVQIKEENLHLTHFFQKKRNTKEYPDIPKIKKVPENTRLYISTLLPDPLSGIFFLQYPIRPNIECIPYPLGTGLEQYMVAGDEQNLPLCIRCTRTESKGGWMFECEFVHLTSFNWPSTWFLIEFFPRKKHCLW